MDVHARLGDWMQTHSGRQFWPLDPRPEEIDIEDIAHALSNLCRYAGHTRQFYSVAQHSVLVAGALPQPLRMWGLLHDATEAYLVDIPRPIKKYLYGYKDIEDHLMSVIAEKFNLGGISIPQAVKEVDDAILADERAQLMQDKSLPWKLVRPPLGIHIIPWEPKVAFNAFLNFFYTLQDERSNSPNF